MDALDIGTVDTVAGEYTIEVHYSEGDENPLTEWSNPGMAFYVTGERSITTDTLDDADESGATLRAIYTAMTEYRSSADWDGITRRYAKWRAISGSPWTLVAGNDMSSRSDGYDWLVLVDAREDFGPNSPEEVAKSTMETYRAWAAGEVYGYVVKGPDGDEVPDGSCWGFYGYDDREGYMMDQAREAVAADVAERVGNANLAGAGFVGVI